MAGWMGKIFALAAALSISVPAWSQDVESGEEIYMNYCATCHGLDAIGNGPMAGVLVIQPTNLTKLVTSGGEFPTERVVARIDGQEPLVSHGSPMPVYGPFFEGRDATIKTDSGQSIPTSKPIADLVAYLKTLQGQQ
ncbi:c-type cytochrome [Ruegeria arenilitoris]|uniref:c-type cytochrome n=1 Tax=Ruegeria arenilitoris TaxID=1173585 RepID=UPI0020C1D388|nr:cytochrome c [Ruegeria arenilitoris]